MIDEIQVRNIALIRDASIEPAPGLTAITGETGTGKTALLSACKLLMGQRADKGMVREGESEAAVSGRFFMDGDEIVVTRRLSADGRSRVKVNGELASVSELSAVIAPSIDLCSQHDHQKLTKPASQRHFLDVWGEVLEKGFLKDYEDAFERVNAAEARLHDLRENVKASDAKVEQARFKLRQIDAVNPDPEDYSDLMRVLSKSENAEMLARVTSEARYSLSEEGGALDSLNAAIALIDDGNRADPALSEYANSLREATYIVEDVARDIATYADAIDIDVSELAVMQERAAAYQSLMRSYGPTVEDVVRNGEEARAIICAIDNSEELEREAQKELQEAEAALHEAAEALTAARGSAAPAFAQAVSDVMSRLEMGSARLECLVEGLPRDQWSTSGPDNVTFMFVPAADMQARPLSRIASGGELSRVMLALHVVMGEKDDTPALVFDEIDAGIGGSVAIALGDVLAELSKTHQVMVVTHLAQIAVKAERQYVVEKRDEGGIAATEMAEVEGESRIREIARMLSGSITDASIAHARELLQKP